MLNATNINTYILHYFKPLVVLLHWHMQQKKHSDTVYYMVISDDKNTSRFCKTPEKGKPWFPDSRSSGKTTICM